MTACAPSEDSESPPSSAAANRPPSQALAPDALSDFNLLIITIDTLRADRLGSYGDATAETPHLDAMAERGVRFENSYSHVPLTLPSHASLFTGRYPFSHGVRNNGNYFLPQAERTLAELMQERGFHTRADVASFIVSAKFGLGQGFDSYDDSLGSGDLIRGFSSEAPADEVGARFRAWLAQRRDRPFFAWVHFYDPHQPYRPPAPYSERFADDPYAGEIAFVDAEIGRICDDLERLGQLENTLIIVTSDHGEGFGEHGAYGHGILAYEVDLRVPLIFSAGSRLTPSVVPHRVRLIDILPTLIDLYGLEEPPGIEGESFATLLGVGRGDPGDPGARDVYFESMLGRDENNWAPLTGLIVANDKYIALPQPELYDLEEDPGELDNQVRSRRGVRRSIDEALQELMLSARPAGEAQRDRSGEDLAHLEALGYISSDSARTSQVIDPKQGIRLERELQKVREQVAAGELERAAEGLAQLEELNREIGVGSYYFLLHQVAAARQDSGGAIAALEAGMERFPESERFPFLLAHYLLQQGKTEEAERLTRQVLDKSPKFSQAIILLGRAVEQQGNLAQAIEHYRAAYLLEPRNVSLGRRLAAALVRSGDGVAALNVYDALAASGALDGDAEELVKVAMLSSRFGKPDRAVDLFEQVLELQPSGMHHLSFAFVLAQLQRIEEATLQMEIALNEYGHELNPQQQQLAQQALRQWRGQ
ncbi:MAG: sulfatase-like hydrolase/transferase [Acidobacteriota bacterium]